MANILLTGASGEIGMETARAFAEYGHNLALCGYKNMDALNSLAEELKKEYGVTIYTYKANAADSSEVVSTVGRALQDLGSIDLLINNAGRSVVKLDQDVSSVEWEELCATNLSSCMYFSREVIKGMIANHKGRIINISSMWGVYGAACEAAYSATKGGINAYTKALAKELAPSGISVNAIAFGAIDTKMNGHLSKEEKEAFEETIPFGRMATAKEAAHMIYNLYTAPAYLTGQIIGFDGGI